MGNYEFLILFIVGILGGFLSGLIGVGGGIIFVPVLDYYFKKFGFSGFILVSLTLANSFLGIFFSGLSGSLKNYKSNILNLKPILFISISAVISSLIFSVIIKNTSFYTELMFKIFFSIIILFTIFKFVFKKEKLAISNPSNIKLIIVGLVTGIISSLTGLGGGIIMIPLLTLWYGLEIKVSAKISLAVIPILVLPLIIWYAFQPLHTSLNHTGYIIWPIILPLLIGTIIAAPLGIWVSKKIKSTYITIIFVTILIVTLIKMLKDIIL